MLERFEYYLMPQVSSLIPSDGKQNQILDSNNNNKDDKREPIKLPGVFGRAQIISSLISMQCLSDSNKFENKRSITNINERIFCNCKNCYPILKFQRFLSKSMIQFQLTKNKGSDFHKINDTNNNDCENKVNDTQFQMKVFVCGPNASMVYLNNRQISTGNNKSQRICQCTCQNTSSKKDVFKKNLNKTNSKNAYLSNDIHLPQLCVQFQQGNKECHFSQLSEKSCALEKMNDQCSPIETFVDPLTRKTWIGGLPVKSNDLLSLINLDQKSPSFSFIYHEKKKKTLSSPVSLLITKSLHSPRHTRKREKFSIDIPNKLMISTKRRKGSIDAMNTNTSMKLKNNSDNDCFSSSSLINAISNDGTDDKQNQILPEQSSSPLLSMHHFSGSEENFSASPTQNSQLTFNSFTQSKQEKSKRNKVDPSPKLFSSLTHNQIMVLKKNFSNQGTTPSRFYHAITTLCLLSTKNENVTNQTKNQSFPELLLGTTVDLYHNL